MVSIEVFSLFTSKIFHWFSLLVVYISVGAKMNILLEWMRKVMRIIGIDAASLRNMNKPLKLMGLFFIVSLVLALVFESPKSPEQKAIEVAVRQNKMVENEANSAEIKKTLVSISGWVSVACFALAAIIEPKEPKRDGRYRTGFKNNATVRRKTSAEIRVQVAAVVVGLAAGAVWYFAS